MLDKNRKFEQQRLFRLASLKSWIRPAIFAAGTVLTACTTPSSHYTSEITPAPILETRAISTLALTPTRIPTVEATSTPSVLPAETVSTQKPESFLPICLVSDPRAAASKNPMPAIFPREETAVLPHSAEEILNLFQSRKNIQNLSIGSDNFSFNLQKEISTLKKSETQNQSALIVNYSQLGFAYTSSQIIDKRADSIMSLYIQPGAFIENTTYSGIYAPFRNCANGFELAMTKQKDTLFLVMDYDQPHTAFNLNPIRRRYLMKIPGFDVLEGKGALISAETISGIYLGNVQVNGRNNQFEIR